ncbi:OmpH family outer membrane protein [Thiorhodococcus mannitoliphagus]|uniref:OmpH family outer membrane protein n=1 Tax=Thiorhodococcus mannitoliphagus TaxID=329406 RepID=A0A6P1E0G8_9GAMM|nr:OmpH family outer membrane protein [Thiorhodococcus mannitoliphagus]NEX22763.1 OmpH family outer membrane protein [Thiorhodococcus mannitoliphagus]
MTRLYLLVALVLSVILPVQAANETSVGYVDMQRVLEESKLGQRLQEQLRKDFEPRAKELAEEELAIKQMQQELGRNKPLMSNAQVEKKEEEIKSRIESYQKEAMPVQQELMKVQQEKGREIIGPARKAVDAVAKKKKIGMVLERGLAGLVYIDESLDITDSVIKQLDSTTK